MKKEFKEIQNRIKTEKNKYQLIGGEIKNKRRILSKTLESLSDIGTSVSYISKIENNKITPNHTSLLELCEKVNISNEEVEWLTNFHEEIKRTIYCFFFSQFDEIDRIYEKVSNKDIHLYLFIHLFHYHIHHDELNFIQVLNKLRNIVSSLSDQELALFLFLTMIYDYEQESYANCLETIKWFHKLNIKNEYLNVLYNEYEFFILLKTYPLNISEKYRSLLFTYTKLNAFYKITILKKKYLETMIMLNCDLEQLGEAHSVNADLELEQLQSIVQKDEEKLKEIARIDHNTFYKFLALCYLNRAKEAKETFQYLLEQDALSNNDLLLSNYLILKLNGDKEEQKYFLINHSLKRAYETSNFLFLHYYLNELIQINNALSKYKENSMMFLKYFELLSHFPK